MSEKKRLFSRANVFVEASGLNFVVKVNKYNT